MLNGIFFTPPLIANYLQQQMDEIYKDRVYDPFLGGKKDLTIIDLGANIGVTSYYFARFAKVVYAVEPASEHFEALRKMVEFNSIPTIIPIKKAIGVANGQSRLIKNQVNLTQFSINPFIEDGMRQAGWPRLPDEAVETITIDKLFKDNKIEHCDFMKMDIEGMEIDVLGGAGFSSVANKIDMLVVERHSWAGRHPHQLDEALKNNGFKVAPLQIEGGADVLVATK